MGDLLGALGRLWGSFGAFKIEFFSNMGPRWAPRGLLDKFGLDLGRFGTGFGRVGRGALLLYCCILSLARIVCPLLEFILRKEPPRYLATPRGASQYAGVPRTLTRVKSRALKVFS